MPSNPKRIIQNWATEPLFFFTTLPSQQLEGGTNKGRMTMQVWFIRLFESLLSSCFVAHEMKNVVTIMTPSIPDFTATFTCRDSMELFADGISLGKDNGGWRTATDFVIPGDTKIIAVEAKSSHYRPGILGSFSNGLVTNSNWKCSERSHLRWNSPDFDDSSWPAAWEVQRHGDGPGGYIAGIDRTAKWIWTFRQRLGSCYCRLNLQ